MPFEKIIKTIIENAIANYNEQSYDEMSKLLSNNIEFICPEINLPLIQKPAVHLKKREDLFSFWKEAHSKFDLVISKTTILQLGKHSIVHCHYEDLNMILENEIFFDQYSQVYKLTNRIIAQ